MGTVNSRGRGSGGLEQMTMPILVGTGIYLVVPIERRSGICSAPMTRGTGHGFWVPGECCH